MRMSRILAIDIVAGMALGCKIEKFPAPYMYTALAAPVAAKVAPSVGVAVNEAAHRVDITIDGQPFTSYLWATNQRKPVLYPLIAPDGTTVTRGYPFAMRPGERVDTPTTRAFGSTTATPIT